MAQSKRPNPSVEEALTLVMKEMQAGSAFPFDEESQKLIPSLYRRSFGERLQTPEVWADQRAAVLNAARQVGVIASALATLQFQPEPRRVRKWMVDEAARLVERYCSIGEEEGQWCKREQT
jgi:hypothetical protein